MADNQRLKRISVNGTELAYTEHGEGIPVIFVHGSLGDYRTWDFQVEPFSKSFRAVVYSRRYHYPNQWTGDGSDYSVALHSSDLSEFINGLGLSSANLIGASYGAYVSLYTAAKHPELVNSLVLGEPPILPWLADIDGGQILAKEFSENAFAPSKKAFQEGNMEKGVSYFINGVLGEGTFNRLSPKVKEMMMENAAEMKTETTAIDYFSPLNYEDVMKIKLSVLLLKGERSPKLFHLIIDTLHHCLPQSEEITVPDSSHSMQTGNPQFFNEKVIEFLKKNN